MTRSEVGVLRELKSQYRGMLRLRCHTPEAYRICEELRLRIQEFRNSI